MTTTTKTTTLIPVNDGQFDVRVGRWIVGTVYRAGSSWVAKGETGDAIGRFANEHAAAQAVAAHA